MKKKIVLILIIIIFVVGLILLNNILQKENNKEIVQENTALNIQENEKEEVVINVTSKNFKTEVLESEKTVLIDFYADWCGPCKVLSPRVEKFAEENEDIKVVKIDIDDEPDLAIEYDVMSIPALVVIKDGEEVDRVVGLVPKSTIEELVK